MTARAALLLVAMAGFLTPARAQTIDDAEWDRLRSEWDPAADDVGVLAELAGAAAEARDLPRFHAVLDSVVRKDAAGPNALRYWAAVGLQLGASPDSVAARLSASIDSDTDAATLAEFVGLLEANEAVGPALELLDEAAAAGAPASRVALVRGQLLAGTGDREGAVEAWLLAIGSGGAEAAAAAARIGDLVADGRGVPAGTMERVASLREVGEGEVASAVAMLAVRVHAADGRWSEAREAAGDPALDGVARGEALREIARRARDAGELDPAREALVALVALGPPAARQEDRLALGEVEDALGNPSAAAESFEQARIGGASGARALEIAAELEAARASGDPEVLARAVDEARAAGADPAILAVPLGDLLLSRSLPDSALSAYAAGIDEGPVGPAELEALSRVRLAQALAQSGSPAASAAELGDALVRAPADPARASERLADLAATLGAGDTLDVARSLVLALAAEWRGPRGRPGGRQRGPGAGGRGGEVGGRDPRAPPRRRPLGGDGGRHGARAAALEVGRRRPREHAVRARRAAPARRGGIVDRREFLRALAGASAGALAGPALSQLGASPARTGAASAIRAGARAASFLIPMDEEQPQPLRAYGIVYRALESGGRAEWLLNFRGGAFLVDHPPALDEALDRGVWTEDPSTSTGALQAALGTEDTVPMKLEVAPKIAVYVPPYAAPWDDAVRLALDFAEIPYRSLWDSDVLREGLAEVDWLHLHHEDFTGQYGKYGLGVQTAAWYQQAVTLDRATADEFGFADGRALKAAVADTIRDYVATGGFLFAMCASSETLDVTLSGG